MTNLIVGPRLFLAGLVFSIAFISGCAGTRPPLKTVEQVDLQRFMGPWYVIACIPVFIEARAYNEKEAYALRPDGTIDTVLTFREGGFNGKAKRYNPRGFVIDRVSNSRWAMQFLWPFKAEYLITHLDEGYTATVIGRTKRDYVWIMARTPQISDADYERLLKIVADQGYDLKKIRRVPQQWVQALDARAR